MSIDDSYFLIVHSITVPDSIDNQCGQVSAIHANVRTFIEVRYII